MSENTLQFVTEKEITVPRRSGLKIVPIRVTAEYLHQDASHYVIREKFYFEEQVTIANPYFGLKGYENEKETRQEINRIELESRTIPIPLQKIGELFQNYGTSIYKTKDYRDQILQNFAIIYKAILVSSNYYGTNSWKEVI